MDANNDQSANSVSSERSSSSEPPKERPNNSLPIIHCYPRDQAEQVLKIGYWKSFLSKQEILPEEIVHLVEPPAALYEKVYNHLAATSIMHPFPSSLNGTINLSPFVLNLLCPIVVEINEQFKSCDLEVDSDCVLPRNNHSFLPNQFGNVNFVNQNSKGGQLTRLVVVESHILDSEALQLCMLCLLRAYKMNGDKLPLYGFCSSAIDWNVIKYDGNKFRMLFKRTVMIPRMHERVERMNDDGLLEKGEYEYKQYWLDEGYSKMVAIIYSCLNDQMTRVGEPKS